jgi:hypothetical protein
MRVRDVVLADDRPFVPLVVPRAGGSGRLHRLASSQTGRT